MKRASIFPIHSVMFIYFNQINGFCSLNSSNCNIVFKSRNVIIISELLSCFFTLIGIRKISHQKSGFEMMPLSNVFILIITESFFASFRPEGGIFRVKYSFQNVVLTRIIHVSYKNQYISYWEKQYLIKDKVFLKFEESKKSCKMLPCSALKLKMLNQAPECLSCAFLILP